MTTVPLRPRISAYPLAALSVLLLGVAVTVLYLLVHEISRIKNRHLLQPTLRVGNIEEQAELISRLYNVHPWISSVVRALNITPAPQDRRTVAEELLALHRALKTNRSGLALQQYEKSTYLLALQQQSPPFPELTPLPQQFAELARLVQELERGLLRERGITERTERAEGRHLLLGQDLALFLGLPASSATRSGFYAGGLFAELPTVEGIPDNLDSPAALKEVLVQLGTAPRIESSNQQEAFTAKVESLRTASNELEAELSVIAQEAKIVQAQLTGQRAALELANKRTIATIEQILQNLIPASPLRI